MDILDKYWKVKKTFNFMDYINPINLESERIIFKSKLSKGLLYNPKFNYIEFDFNSEKYINELKDIKCQINSKYKLQQYYENQIELDILKVQKIILRESNQKSFAQFLTSLYGTPNNTLYNKATDLLAQAKSEKHTEKSHNALDLKSRFEKELNNFNFHNWTIELADIPANISITPTHRHIKIKRNLQCTLNDIERLVAHEIYVHVLRNENGKSQPDKFFQYGFPNYLSTEEGLAITSEFKSGLLLKDDLKKYACRVYCAYHSITDDFYTLFNKVLTYYTFDEAFDIVSRIKRGLIDTSLKGGFTKDQIYLKGFFDLKKFSDEELKYLFCGKIGIEDISFIQNNFELKDDFIVPKWLHNEE